MSELLNKLRELRKYHDGTYYPDTDNDVERIDECIRLSVKDGGQGDDGDGGELGECPKTGTGPNGGTVAEDSDRSSSAPNVPFATQERDEEPNP